MSYVTEANTPPRRQFNVRKITFSQLTLAHPPRLHRRLIRRQSTPGEYRHDAQIYHCGRHPPRQSSVGIRLLTALAASAPARAELATPEQKKACTPDVYRLCAGEIPNARAITACLRRQKANVSEAGRAVFEQ